MQRRRMEGVGNCFRYDRKGLDILRSNLYTYREVVSIRKRSFSALAIILIFLVLAAQLNSLRDPFVILAGPVPLAIPVIFVF